MRVLEKHLPKFLEERSESSGNSIFKRNEKRGGDGVPSNEPQGKRLRLNDYGTDPQVVKAVNHLEVEFKYNPIPSDEVKRGLADFTGLEFAAICAWFEVKNGSRLHRAPDSTKYGANISFGSQNETPNAHLLSSSGLSMSQLSSFSSSSGTLSNGPNESPSLNEPEESSAIPEPETEISSAEVAYGSKQDTLTNKGRLKHQAFMGRNPDITKPYTCTKLKCLRRFKNKHDWKRHEESICYRQFTFYCLLRPECRDRTFLRRDKLQQHLKRDHDNHDFTQDMKHWRKPALADKTFPCPICDEEFETWDERCDHIGTLADDFRARFKECTVAPNSDENKQ